MDSDDKGIEVRENDLIYVYGEADGERFLGYATTGKVKFNMMDWPERNLPRGEVAAYIGPKEFKSLVAGIPIRVHWRGETRFIHPRENYQIKPLRVQQSLLGEEGNDSPIDESRTNLDT